MTIELAMEALVSALFALFRPFCSLFAHILLAFCSDLANFLLIFAQVHTWAGAMLVERRLPALRTLVRLVIHNMSLRSCSLSLRSTHATLPLCVMMLAPACIPESNF